MDNLLHAFYILVIFVLVIILIVTKVMEEKKKSLPKKLNLKGAYLNYASTNAKNNGSLNPSDLAYPQVMEQRQDMIRIENKIKKIINAPVEAKVIINSGATESIANCVFWAKNYNRFGVIVGSEFDHSAVADNCETFDVPYEQTLRSGKINDRCSMIFITQVSSKTGEIVNVQNFKHNVLDKYTFEYTDGNNPFSTHVRQYRPLVVLDATQSIMKVPIDMDRWKLNAVFFSLHKIGGPIGLGVLVINDTNYAPFKPLISGKQQNELRGGTFPLNQFLESEQIFSHFDDFNKRTNRWNKIMNKLKDAGLKVYEPKGQHLYNTFLIDVGRCPLGIINSLALKNIFVGNTSACKNEELMNNSINRTNKEIFTKKPFEKAIRITFSEPNDITDDTLNTIIEELQSKDE